MRQIESDEFEVLRLQKREKEMIAENETLLEKIHEMQNLKDDYFAELQKARDQITDLDL